MHEFQQRTAVKRLILPPVLALVVLLTGSVPAAAAVERHSMEFSDPSRPGTVRVRVEEGRVTVEGHAGKHVEVELTREEAAGSRPATADSERPGLRRLPSRGSSVDLSESDNVVVFKMDSGDTLAHATIRIPRSASLDVKVSMDAELRVANVNGEIEINSSSGSVELDGVRGPVVAHAHAGDIKARLLGDGTVGPMAFTSWAGDIDVTFPATLGAVLKMRTKYGELYTDFDVSNVRHAVERDVRDRRVKLESYTFATINRGGPEILLENYSGDIIVRRAKQ